MCAKPVNLAAAAAALLLIAAGCEGRDHDGCGSTSSERISTAELDQRVPEWRETFEAFDGDHNARLYVDDDYELPETPPAVSTAMTLRIDLDDGAEVTHFDGCDDSVTFTGDLELLVEQMPVPVSLYRAPAELSADPHHGQSVHSDLGTEETAAIHEVLPETASEPALSLRLDLNGPVSVALGSPVCSGQFVVDDSASEDVVAEFVCDD